MEIREPKYKAGDEVYCEESKCNVIITDISEYSFADDEYYYGIRYDDGDNDEIIESLLEPYTEKPKTVWDLKEGDAYYVVDYDFMSVRSVIFFNDTDDLNYRYLGNCFLTKEEAESELERVKIEAEMLRLGGRRKFNRGKDNYFIMYTRIEGLDYVNYQSMHEQGVIYFDSELDAINAVKTIGKDKIKKYIFVE